MYRTIFCLLTASLFISCHYKPVVYDDPIPEHKTIVIISEFVQEERIVNIWTPKSYDESTNNYPVLYMPDGGAKEDFPHIANTLEKLIAADAIPPVILVGIENTDRRRDLSGISEHEEDAKYCPLTDGAKSFRKFISEELIPIIERDYRTSSTRGIIGESLAGLFIVETLFLNPEIFDFYIAMDPSIWWNNFYIDKNAENLIANLPQVPLKLWFAGSQAKDISIPTNKLAGKLTTNAPDNLTWKFSDEPKEKHSTIYRATKEKALIWSLNDNE